MTPKQTALLTKLENLRREIAECERLTEQYGRELAQTFVPSGSIDDATPEQWDASAKRSAPSEREPQWIDWHGGARPVDAAAEVHVTFRDDSDYAMRADRLRWTHCGWPCDIVKYRVIK